MRFFATLIALASAAFALEDGKLYTTHLLTNGTLVTYDGITGAWVETLTEGPLVDAYREAAADKARNKYKQRRGKPLAKRATSCWNTPLDHWNVDMAVNDWKSFLISNGGLGLCSNGVQNGWTRFVRGGVQVYYCLNTNVYCGHLDINDFNYALGQMDANCAPYTSSYFQWNSPEIVGKSRTTTAVCTG